MAYTLAEATFEGVYGHRDVSVWPGSTQFTALVAKYSRDLNDYLGVEDDISDRADSCSDIVAALIEQNLKWREDQSDPEKMGVSEPSIFDENNTALQSRADSIKGYIDTEDDPAYSGILRLYDYGGSYLD